MIFQKWYTEITLVVHKEFSLTVVALVDLGADMNCIQEELIPSKYYESITDKLTQANCDRLKISNKLTKTYIYNNGINFRREMICPQHFQNIFTIFLQQILSGRLLLVLIVGAKK